MGAAHVTLFAAALAVGLGSTLPGGAPPVDYQKAADRSTWRWEPERAGVVAAAELYRGPYQVEIVRPPGERVKFRVRLTDGGREVFAWDGHAHTVFAQDGDVLYYADYWPDRTGCEIVARDLKAGKELWRTSLYGVGPIKHSGYSNRVALDADRVLVTVRGKETMGRYLEFLDARTGRTLGHRIYEGPFRRKQSGEWVNLPVEQWKDPSPFP
jgi:hypothetical protein